MKLRFTKCMYIFLIHLALIKLIITSENNNKNISIVNNGMNIYEIYKNLFFSYLLLKNK